MENTNTLLVNQLHNGISSPINNMDNIPISLGIVYHEAFEFGFVTPFFGIVAFSFLQSIHWASVSSIYISQIKINITLQ